MSLITLGLATDFLTAGGAASSVALDADSPMGYQQMERTRANFNDILNNLAYLKHAQVTLTNAQIKALPTTPITLISAPASGQRIHVVSASIRSDATAGIYTNLNSTYCALSLYYLGDFSQWATVGIVNDHTASPAYATRLSGMLATAGKVSANCPPYTEMPGNGWVLPNNIISTVTDAKALAIAADNNGSGNFTGGNAANSMIVNVLYVVL